MRQPRRLMTMVVAALFVLVAACREATQPPPVPDRAAIRKTASGAVVGFARADGAHVWLGIPFAAPPVGPLRWRAAESPHGWTGTRPALAFGSPCVQYASPFGGVEGKDGEVRGSEDCLYLNIYAPRLTSKEVVAGRPGLPVMLWIHGGGNTIGHAGFYDPSALATAQKLVVVTVNYRVGPFGWFRHPALRGEGTSELDASGNFGTLDLVRALEWVRDNIAEFGGDPAKVTIFGESAGGLNVFTLLLSPSARGLFHRAIVQSGGLQESTVAEAEHALDDPVAGHANSSSEVLLRLLVRDGRARYRADARSQLATMPPTDVAHYLRQKTSDEILRAYTPMPRLGMIDMPKVFRDGTVLPDADPLERLAVPDGFAPVPVMMGTNRDEMKIFMFADPMRVRRILWLIPRVRDERWYSASAEHLSKLWKATGADEPARRMRAAQGPPVFVYRFDWDEEPRLLGADLSMMLGAAHGFEIPFVFGHFDLGRQGNIIFSAANEPGRRELSAQMMAYWAEFAATGAPGRGRAGQLPEWSAWDATSPKFMVLDTAAGGGLRMSAETVTVADVLAAVEADPRLPTQRDKCRAYRELAQWGRALTKEQYPTVGRQGCTKFPFETYPWE